nr:response regulator [Paracoccus saliphilus]
MSNLNKSSPADRFSVLVVEDEPLIALDVQMLLEQQGHHVLGPVDTVEKALRLLDNARPDVVILDLNLRGRLVTPVAERLRDLTIPFIIASADTSVVAGDAVYAQAEEVAKPIRLEHLLAALYRAVDGK